MIIKHFVIIDQISDGPEYNILLHAEIEKPPYHFTCMEYNFGKCIVNAPDSTYKKNLAFFNEDKVPLMYGLLFRSIVNCKHI